MRRWQPDKNIIKWVSARSKTNRGWLEKNGCGEDFRRALTSEEHGHMIDPPPSPLPQIFISWASTKMWQNMDYTWALLSEKKQN